MRHCGFEAKVFGPGIRGYEYWCQICGSICDDERPNWIVPTSRTLAEQIIDEAEARYASVKIQLKPETKFISAQCPYRIYVNSEAAWLHCQLKQGHEGEHKVPECAVGKPQPITEGEWLK